MNRLNLCKRGRHACCAVASLALTLSISTSGSAQGVLFDNGPIITQNPPVAGLPAGTSASALQTALNLNAYGFGVAKSAGLRIADDFSIPANVTWDITSVTFYSYQTGSTTTSPISQTNVRIWSGAPNGGGSLVYDGSAGNQQTSSVFSSVYRILDTGTPSTARPIMSTTALIPGGLSLGTGTFWVDWQHDGSTSFSGPFSVPVTILGLTGKAGANAIQFNPNPNPAWAPVIDTGNPNNPPASFAQDLAFRVNGFYGVLPTGYTITDGFAGSGNLQSLFVIDSDRLGIGGDEFQPNMGIEITTISPVASCSSFVFSYTARCSRTDMSETVRLWNWTLNGGAGGWDPTAMNTRTPTLTDSTFNLSVVVNQNNFIKAGTREMRARLVWTPNNEVDGFDGWGCDINRTRWSIAP